MRFHYLSDLHLESEDWTGPLPCSDVLVIAGDLGHARCFAADADDGYARIRRERMERFARRAVDSFERVLLVMGNHDHYDGVFDDTARLFREHLHGVSVLDDEAVDIGDVRIFGTTLWSDFEGGDPEAMKRANKGCGEFFFVKRRVRDENGNEHLARFRAADALEAHRRSLEKLHDFLSAPGTGKSLVVSHHPPTTDGLNPAYRGKGLDGAFASNLEDVVLAVGPDAWVHGHTHIRREYSLGPTTFYANCRGFPGKEELAASFSADHSFVV